MNKLEDMDHTPIIKALEAKGFYRVTTSSEHPRLDVFQKDLPKPFEYMRIYLGYRASSYSHPHKPDDGLPRWDPVIRIKQDFWVLGITPFAPGCTMSDELQDKHFSDGFLEHEVLPYLESCIQQQEEWMKIQEMDPPGPPPTDKLFLVKARHGNPHFSVLVSDPNKALPMFEKRRSEFSENYDEADTDFDLYDWEIIEVGMDRVDYDD